MKTRTKKLVKNSDYVVDETPGEYDDVVLFPEKLEEVKEFIKKHPIPKELIELARKKNRK